MHLSNQTAIATNGNNFKAIALLNSLIIIDALLGTYAAEASLLYSVRYFTASSVAQ